MKDRVYLTYPDVLLLQHELISKFGGQAGLLDPSLLKSALARPRSGYYDGLVAEGCALFQSLWLNHAFLDGNKRIALASLDLFFRLNGFRLDISSESNREQILNLRETEVRDFSYLLSIFSKLIKEMRE